MRGEITYLRRFGRVVHKLTPKELRKGKISSHSTECIIIGYTDTTKIWSLWDPQTKEIKRAESSSSSSSSIVSRIGRVVNASAIRFDETKIAGKRLQTLPEMELFKSLLLEDDIEHEEGCISVHHRKVSVTEQQSNGKEARKALEQQRSRNPIASEMTMEEAVFE